MSEAKMNIPPNGNGRLSALLSPQFVANIAVLIIGIGVLWGSQVNRVDYLQQQLNAALARLDVYEKAMNSDRTMLTNRLTGLEGDTKYISQTLQELKLSIRPR